MTTPPALTRADGRSASQLRPISFEQSLLSRADGSCRYNQGATTVMIAVFGPLIAPSAAFPTESQTGALNGVVQTTVQTMSATQVNSVQSNKLANHLTQLFSSIILLSLHPRKRIKIVCHIINDDGSTLAACINATMIALIDAGIECRDIVTACEIRIRRNIQSDNPAITQQPINPSDDNYVSDGGQLIIDPTKEEQSVHPTGVTFAFSNRTDGCLLSHCAGVIGEASFSQAYDTAKRACAHIGNFDRAAITKQILSKAANETSV